LDAPSPRSAFTIVAADDPAATGKGGSPMFEGLSDKLSGILDKLTRRGALTEDDVNAALR
jgi:hypothetical protein